jgi:hypothetical protein
MGGQTGFGGSEVVIIMQRAAEDQKGRFGYKLLATTKTSTMQKEMQEAGAAGYEFVGLTVADTGIAGAEVIAILRKAR